MPLRNKACLSRSRYRFSCVLLSSEKGYFVNCSSEGRIESNELDGPIFAENDANRLVEALKTKDEYLTCEKIQAGKINDEYDISTFNDVWHEKSSGMGDTGR